MQVDRAWARDSLSDKAFTALRLRAMDFSAARGLGVGLWPFGYTPAQKERLREMERVVPRMTALTWLFIAVMASFALGLLILFPVIVAIAATVQSNARASGLIIGGIIGGMIAMFCLGTLAGSFIAGRIVNAILPLPPLKRVPGDSQLYAMIRRQAGRIAKFGALGLIAGIVFAAAPALLTHLYR